MDFIIIMNLYFYYSEMAECYFFYWDEDDNNYFKYRQFRFLQRYYKNILRNLCETT